MMGALGRLLLSIEKLTGLKVLGEIGRPLVQMDSQKRQFESQLARKKAELNNVKNAFENVKPKKKSS